LEENPHYKNDVLKKAKDLLSKSEVPKKYANYKFEVPEDNPFLTGMNAY